MPTCSATHIWQRNRPSVTPKVVFVLMNLPSNDLCVDLFSCAKSFKILCAWPAFCQVQQRRGFYGYFVGRKSSKLLKSFRRGTAAAARIGILSPVCAFQRVDKSLLGNPLFRHRTSV